MARFNQKEQTEQRKTFIADCMEKAWGAACHASWMEQSLNELIAHYQKLQAEDKEVEAAIKANAEGFDNHTVENRNKRAEMQKKRTDISNQMKLIAKNTQEGAAAMQRLLDSVDQNLLLADHAKEWSWKEVETAPGEITTEGLG
jgi:transcriptional regulator with PAS, ATPase and Fis domain